MDQRADLFGVPYNAPGATVQKIRNQLAQLQAAAEQYDAAVRQVGDTNAIAIGGAYGDLLDRMASNQPAENIHASALAAQNAVKGSAAFDPKVAQNLIDNTTNLIAIAWYLIEGPDSAADALVACSNLFEGLAGLLGLVGALLGGPFTAVAAGLVVACGVVSKLLGDVAKDVTNASGNGQGEGEGEGDAPADAEGDADGGAEGDAEGDADGDAEGDADGDAEGDAEGDADGDAVGAEGEGEGEGDAGEGGDDVGGDAEGGGAEGGEAEGGEAEGGHGESIHVETAEPDGASDAGISPEELASGRLPSASELIDRSTNRR